LVQPTDPALQQSVLALQAPPTPAQATWLTPTHCPALQKPEQQSKPLTQAAPASVTPGMSSLPGVTEAMQAEMVQKPRMF
jgi:hypothetical protein